MANWKSIVEISDIHSKFRNGEMEIEAVGKELASRLRKNKYAEELMDQIEELELGGYDANGFDDILDSLYDFGDTDHRIFFNSF